MLLLLTSTAAQAAMKPHPQPTSSTLQQVHRYTAASTPGTSNAWQLLHATIKDIDEAELLRELQKLSAVPESMNHPEGAWQLGKPAARIVSAEIAHANTRTKQKFHPEFVCCSKLCGTAQCTEYTSKCAPTAAACTSSAHLSPGQMSRDSSSWACLQQARKQRSIQRQVTPAALRTMQLHLLNCIWCWATGYMYRCAAV